MPRTVYATPILIMLMTKMQFKCFILLAKFLSTWKKNMKTESKQLITPTLIRQDHAGISLYANQNHDYSVWQPFKARKTSLIFLWIIPEADKRLVRRRWLKAPSIFMNAIFTTSMISSHSGENRLNWLHAAKAPRRSKYDGWLSHSNKFCSLLGFYRGYWGGNIDV